MTGLIKYDAACRALAEAKSVDEVKEILNASIAMAAYARQAKNKDLEADAVEIRMRAIRGLDRMRQAQKETVGLNQGARGIGTSAGYSETRTRADKPTLADAGIDKNLAHQARTLGRLSNEDFEGAVKHARTSISNAVKVVLKKHEIEQAREDYEARKESGSNVSYLTDLIEAGKTFPVIYADPPWEFTVYSGKGKQRSAERHYDTMTVDDIAAMPIQRLAADDCALFMWAVMPELPGALELIEAWGFTYKTAGFTWVKQNRNGAGLFTGMGYWTRANAELCLLATRGSPQRLAMDVHQVITAPVREHSRKPDEVPSRIERLLAGPYLELFAREAREGWTTWGNEIKRGDFVEAAE